MRALILLLIAFAAPAHAKDVWLNFVGMDHENPMQNYEKFYQEHGAFLEVCRRNKSRDCLSYINGDPKLFSEMARKDADALRAAKTSSGVPTQSGAIAQIKKALAQAKAGDQVVISLVNHGSPDPKFGRRSCIWLQNFQPLCDEHLKELIGDLPEKKGFRVLVSADGCYSGGFAALASKNTCVATGANQFHVGYGAYLWPTVRDSGARTLKEVAARVPRYSTLHLGSQLMQVSVCREARERAAKWKWGLPEKLQDWDQAFSEMSLLECRQSAETTSSESARALTSGVLKALQFVNAADNEKMLSSMQQILCRDTSSTLCSSFHTLNSTAKDWTALRRLREIERQIKDLEAEFDRDVLLPLKRAATGDELRLVLALGFYGKEEIARFKRSGSIVDRGAGSAADQARIEEQAAKIRPKLARIEEKAGQLREEMTRLLNGKGEAFLKAMNEVRLCLQGKDAGSKGQTGLRNKNPREVEEYDKQARQFETPDFNSEQMKQAQDCESSFKF